MNKSSIIRTAPTIAVLAVYVAIQSCALFAPWFPADDAQELAFVRALESGWALFGVDVFGLFRPVKNLLFLAFAHLETFGMPFVRLLAIAVGVASFFPVRALFRRVFPDERLSLLAAAIWLLAPTLVSSTVWLSCVNIQVMSAFAAGAFVCHDDGRRWRAAALLFLSCVSYECAVAVGPCLFVFDFFLRPSRLRDRRAWVSYALYAAVTVGFLALRQSLGSASSVNGSFANCSRLEIVLASAYLSCQHFLSWLWPFGRMTAFGGYAGGSVPAVTLVGCWVAVAAAGVGALVLRRRCPTLAFGLAFALVGFLPVSNVTGVGNGPYGDYYLDLASFGLAAVLVSLCRVRVVRPLVILVRLAAVAAAFHWASLWAGGERAFFAGAENFPAFFGNRIFLVTQLADADCFEDALRLGREVEVIVGSDSGQMSAVWLVRGLYELRERKDAARALACFEKSRKADDFGGALRNCDYYVGCVYEDLLGDKAKAERLYASALKKRWTVDSVDPANRLAILRAERGDLAGAIGLWERALRCQPGNRLVALNLAKAKRELDETGSGVPVCCPLRGSVRP